MKAINLKTEHLIDPIGVDIQEPFIAWTCQGDVAQTAFEIEAKSNGSLIWNSGKVSSDRMNTVMDVSLTSRQRVQWRVRLWNEKGEADEWSEPAVFEMGLLDRTQLVATWINPELSCDPAAHKPASSLRTSFDAAPGEAARLYITAHGLYEAFINGQRVGDFVLAPGTSSYDQRLAYQTYDVTSLICTGENEVLVTLGDGWYRSCSGVDGDRNLYGDDIALYFQLEIDGRPACLSDETWQATQDGPIRQNDMQQGEVYDARMEALSGWHAVKTEDFGTANLICSNSLPICEMERFSGRLITTPNQEWVIDYGQNLAGYVEFTIMAHEGDTIVMTHGESLDESGNFTAENFQDRKRHKEGGTEQRVTYICKEGLNHYKSRFTIFGFRYARVETDIDLSTARFTSIAVYSRMEQTAWFECSDERVNQLVHNSIWSMKSNFCDVPTDCPTRERAAWTGDMGVFADTGITLADSFPVIRKWLAECRATQYPDGKVANIAPRNNRPTFFSEMLSGSVGWGDACVIVPYVLYKSTGDQTILQENYEMMRRWYSFLEQRAGQKSDKSIIAKENPYSAYTIETGVDYGEWCELGVSPQAAMSSPQFKVATAYYASTGRQLAEIAEILGKADDARRYADIAANAAKAFHHVATDNGRIHSERQAEYVRAISFGLLSTDEAQMAADDLNQLVISQDYHLNTGFLSTPAICDVLTRYGHLDTAYRLLLQDSLPSWLYSVKKGATTVWETWDGINEKGEVNGSLNHYAYGAICGWLFAGICGIRLENGRLTLSPQPHPLLRFARATFDSPIGKIISAWHYENDHIAYEIEIPANVQAQVKLSDGRQFTLSAGIHHL